MRLQTYHKKRDFKKTAEPFGRTKASATKKLYIIQKHAASHLHYDFRLELDSTLKSWAIPKGPSLNPSTKRLAIHVEDHPIEYGSFEGIIPAGEYGGGTVMMWDTGTWECLDENPLKAYKSGHLKILLKGKKLKGLWKLVRINKDPKNWLLIKADDKYAQIDKVDITDVKTKSVLSKMSMDQIAKKHGLVWTKKGAVATKKRLKAKRPSVKKKV